MRIAIVRTDTSILEPENYNCQELGLAKALVRRGHSVDVFLNGPEREVDIQFAADGCRFVRLVTSPATQLPFIQQGLNLTKINRVCDGRYDFVQINESNEIESCLLSSRLYRINIPNAIYQGMYVDLTGRIQKVWQCVFRYLALPRLRKTTGIVFAKTDAANRFITRKGFSRVVTLPVGLDNASLELGTSVNWREELEIPSDSKVVLYVGKLEPRRNTRLMLSLVERMKSESAFFVFAGEGVDFVSAKEIAAKSNLTNVRFLGNVPQRKMKSLYEEAYCLMLASDYEIYGMVILEAMFFGVPVVTSRTAGAEQIISHNVDGVIVDGIDVDLWHDALVELLQDQEWRSQMAKHARKKIASDYTWDRIAERYESCVDALCTGRMSL